MQKIKIGAVSLGCDKNRVDTENMLAKISEGGYEITPDATEADIIIINTCAFIESSKVEALDTIFEFAKLKEERGAKLIVTGCLPERYKETLFDSIPEVDAFLGIDEYDKINDAIKRVVSGERFFDFEPCNTRPLGRVLTTPYHYAYLKIADGCDNHCTYCAIPSIRGKYRSRTVDSLVDEAKALIDNYGVRELNIVAQDVTRYGVDIYGEYAIMKLLDKLTALDIGWVRLLYCYPELLTDDLIKYIAQNEKMCNYIDVPMQHINNRILKLMGRRTSGKEIISLIEKVRNTGDIALRSSFIVGFPGETQQEFEELKNFIQKYRLEYAGFFAYSKEEGTPAARLRGQIPERVKRARQEEMMALQSQIIFDKNESRTGEVIKVLYEGVDFDRQMFYGRPEFCAPEVDARIYFTSQTLVEAGGFYNIKITSYDGYDMIGAVI